jgi:hypothetical protein
MMNTTKFRRRGAAVGQLLITFVLLASACGGASDSADDSSSDAANSSDAAAEDAAGPTAPGEQAAGEEAPAAPEEADVDLDEAAAAAGRELVSTASLTVEVEDLDAAGEEAVDLAVAAEGFVTGEQTNRGEATSTLTVKVPPTEFRATLDALGELGDVRLQEITTDDVTEAVVDLESRITTAETSVERLRGLTDQAASVDELRSLEEELLTRETTLEQLRGELRTIEDQVSLATITVTLTTEDGAPVVDDDDDEERDLPTFLGGFEAGFDVLVAVGSVALAVLGFLTPFVPPALLVGAIVLLVYRRKDRKRRAEQADLDELA